MRSDTIRTNDVEWFVYLIRENYRLYLSMLGADDIFEDPQGSAEKFREHARGLVAGACAFGKLNNRASIALERWISSWPTYKKEE